MNTSTTPDPIHCARAPMRDSVYPSMLRSSQRSAIAALLILLSACAPIPSVPVNSADTTPPAIQFTSVNLLPEFGVGASVPQSNPVTPSQIETVTTFPEAAGFDGSVPNPEAVVTVKGTDPESGVQGVEVTGRVTSWCNAGWTSSAPARKVDRVLSPVVVGSPSAATSAATPQPAERWANVTLRHADIRAACGGEVLTDFEITLEVVARNGSGQAARSSGRIVRPVQVIVHNMWATCLGDLQAHGDRDLQGAVLCDGLHPQQPGTGPGRSSHLNEQLDRWARTFAKQDIVLLSEARDPAWLARMRLSMPDHALAHYGMVAIFSRWPMTGVSTRSTPAVCVTDLDGTVACGLNAVISEYVRAFAVTPRGTMDVLSLHWQHRPVPVTSHPSRVAFARDITQAQFLSNWAVAGGDFNSKSAWIASPDELVGGDAVETANLRSAHASLAGRSQPEIAEMESAFTNARREVWETDRTHWSHSFPWPVDHLFLRNRLNAVQYTNDRTGVFGSDHPTLRMTLLRR